MFVKLSDMFKSVWSYARFILKWVVISALIGVVTGGVGGGFGLGVAWAGNVWRQYDWILFLMPAIGLLIVWLYNVCKQGENSGTNLILDSVAEKRDINPFVAPLIAVSTILSHSVGSSVGREGAALQIGGGIGSILGRGLRLDKSEKSVAVMCGMSACFAALFGTPLAAAIFVLEVVCVGAVPLAALLPCLTASFIGASVSRFLGVVPEHYAIEVSQFNIEGALIAVLLGAACALVGALFCYFLHGGDKLCRRFLPNPYLRIVVLSLIFIGLTLLFSDGAYNSGGILLIEECFAGADIPYYAFALKMLFTVISISAGFKGGEIVPSFCIGAALGYFIASAFALPLSLCCAMGMVCLFVTVTNCPIASMFIAFELFGFEGMPYYVIAIAVSFAISGKISLYHKQRFSFSKCSMENVMNIVQK